MVISAIKKIYPIIDENGNSATYPTFMSQVFDDEGNALSNVINDFTEKLLASGAGSHNCIYRGKYLGTVVSAEQYTEIAAGTFNDCCSDGRWSYI